MNYYTPTKERKTDVVLSQVLEGRAIQTLSILKGKNRGTAYIYIYVYVYVCVYKYIYIYIYIYIQLFQFTLSDQSFKGT